LLRFTESDDEIPEETLIQKYQLVDLLSEAAKLKSLGCMESIPTDRIIRLLGILEKNIRSGMKVSPIADDVSLYHGLLFNFLFFLFIPFDE